MSYLALADSAPSLDAYFLVRKANPFGYDNKPYLLRYRSVHFTQQEMEDDLNSCEYIEWLELPQ